MIRSATRTALLCAAAVVGTACAPQTTPSPSAALPPAQAIDPQLLEDVRILSADDMQGRDTGSAGGRKARDYIVARLEAIGVAPAPFGRLQPFEAQGRTREGVKTFDGVNIVGLIPGSRTMDRYIVVTAHYDHVGTSDGQI